LLRSAPVRISLRDDERTDERALAHALTTRANSIAILTIARSRSLGSQSVLLSHIRDTARASANGRTNSGCVPPLGRSKDKGSSSRPADARRSEGKGVRSALAWDTKLHRVLQRDNNVCCLPRDDVNTPHESTRLLDRGGRAAQFGGCSRSSLLTRRNSAQVVLLCGECGLCYGARAPTTDLLSLSLSLSSLSAFPPAFLTSCSHFACFPLFHLPAFPLLFLGSLCALYAHSRPRRVFFPAHARYPADPPTPFLPSFRFHRLTDCRPSIYLHRGRAATVDREK